MDTTRIWKLSLIDNWPHHLFSWFIKFSWRMCYKKHSLNSICCSSSFLVCNGSPISSNFMSLANTSSIKSWLCAHLCPITHFLHITNIQPIILYSYFLLGQVLLNGKAWGFGFSTGAIGTGVCIDLWLCKGLRASGLESINLA